MRRAVAALFGRSRYWVRSPATQSTGRRSSPASTSASSAPSGQPERSFTEPESSYQSQTVCASATSHGRACCAAGHRSPGLRHRPARGNVAQFRRSGSVCPDPIRAARLRRRRTKVRVPAGDSWGTPVRRGTSVNVIAEPKGFDRRKPYVVIGAHLDTVPVAPGAEDNASGIAVMLQLAEMVSQQPAAFPVQFIAFGAEEPRGSGDALHHFGSRQFVAGLSRSERRAIQAMVSLDRVGVPAGYVPICTADTNGNRLRDAIRAAARRAEIATRACSNYTSDHWSYAKAGIPAVRLGGIPYAGYHSRGDVPRVVDRRQLDRVGRTVWAWLETLN